MEEKNNKFIKFMKRNHQFIALWIGLVINSFFTINSQCFTSPKLFLSSEYKSNYMQISPVDDTMKMIESIVVFDKNITKNKTNISYDSGKYGKLNLENIKSDLNNFLKLKNMNEINTKITIKTKFSINGKEYNQKDKYEIIIYKYKLNDLEEIPTIQEMRLI